VTRWVQLAHSRYLQTNAPKVLKEALTVPVEEEYVVRVVKPSKYKEVAYVIALKFLQAGCVLEGQQQEIPIRFFVPAESVLQASASKVSKTSKFLFSSLCQRRVC